MKQRYKTESANIKQTSKRETLGRHEETNVSASSFPNSKYFLIVSLVNMILFMGTSLPTPLYRLYNVELGMSSTLLTVVFASCPIAIIPSLFLLGPLGDKYGRERLLKIAVVIGIFGNTLLAVSQDWSWLVLGRIGQGVAIGAGSGNATAAMVEYEPTGNKRRAGQMASTSLLLGLVIGPFLSAFMAEWLPAPTQLIFLVYTGLLIVILGTLFIIRKSRVFSEDHTTFHKFSIATETRLCFLSMSLSVGLSFSLSGFYFSLMPTYATAILGSSILGGSAFVSIMVFVSMLVQLVIPNIQPKKLVIIGQLSIAVGLAFVVLAQAQFSILHLYLGTIICGVAYGTTLQGGIALINSISPRGHRSGVTSAFYAIAYLFLAIPIIILGFALESLSVLYTVKYFALILSIAALTNMVMLSMLDLDCGEQKSILS